MIWKSLLELATPIAIQSIQSKFTRGNPESEDPIAKAVQELKEHMTEFENRIRTMEKKIRALQIYSLTLGVLFSIGFIAFAILCFI